MIIVFSQSAPNKASQRTQKLRFWSADSGFKGSGFKESADSTSQRFNESESLILNKPSLGTLSIVLSVL